MINSKSKVWAHLAAVGCNGQEISRDNLAAIGCNGLSWHCIQHSIRDFLTNSFCCKFICRVIYHTFLSPKYLKLQQSTILMNRNTSEHESKLNIILFISAVRLHEQALPANQHLKLARIERRNMDAGVYMVK